MESEARMPWEIGDGTYRDSRWRDAHDWSGCGVTVCEESGAVATDRGECPNHTGDACLYSSSLLLTYWMERALNAEAALASPSDATVEAVAKAILAAEGAMSPDHKPGLKLPEAMRLARAALGAAAQSLGERDA